MKGWKTIFQANGLKKQGGVAILISNKIDFQPKIITQYLSTNPALQRIIIEKKPIQGLEQRLRKNKTVIPQQT